MNRIHSWGMCLTKMPLQSFWPEFGRKNARKFDFKCSWNSDRAQQNVLIVLTYLWPFSVYMFISLSILHAHTLIQMHNSLFHYREDNIFKQYDDANKCAHSAGLRVFHTLDHIMATLLSDVYKQIDTLFKCNWFSIVPEGIVTTSNYLMKRFNFHQTHIYLIIDKINSNT